MPEKTFQLNPFAPEKTRNAIAINGKIIRQAHLVSVSYVFSGDLDQVLVPGPVEGSVRKTGLWNETCFELFIGEKNVSPYWEMNLSPSGCWNIFRFSGYRKNMAEETRISALPVRLLSQPDVLEISVKIPINKLLPADPPIQAGVSAVIQDRNGEFSFWALTHPGTKPDFHNRDAFRIHL
jgi:hypothetical protein